jgi:hypothetical protein
MKFVYRSRRWSVAGFMSLVIKYKNYLRFFVKLPEGGEFKKSSRYLKYNL